MCVIQAVSASQTPVSHLFTYCTDTLLSFDSAQLKDDYLQEAFQTLPICLEISASFPQTSHFIVIIFFSVKILLALSKIHHFRL
jgi:hypothetical protein